ncbi:putative BRCT domain-containing protein [Senna tora]|uniref:Putative BRCT domain-containing protein n=1 Tax=Senna tora TaxID=362788 RepID=A0A834TM20_9FABA|nr:putative BRCT domain-containing protein [Senna tora]
MANYLVLDRFKSRWLGGWTSEEWDSSSLNQNNAERVPKFFVRETSFLSESADIAPDESSFVQKHDSKCRTGSQPSIPSESLDKPDEGILDSQDMVKCSNLSLDDLLCSVVPCSISSEQANSNTKSDKEINTEKHVPVIDGFDMDNFQRTSDPDVTLDHREEQIMSLPDGEDIPIIVTNTVQQTHEMLTGVDPTCRKQLSSLKTYSMIIPNQSLIEKCNQTLLSTDQRTVIAAPSDKRSSKGLSASKCTGGNKNEQNHEHFDNRNSNIEITCEKRSNNLRAADRGVIPVESSEERRISTLILNDRTPHSLPCPKTVGNDINVEKHPKQHVLPESFAQHQQNNNLNKLQDECNEFHDGHNRVRKQVRFTEAEEQIHLKRTLSKLESSYKKCSSVRAKRRKTSKSSTNYVPHMKHSLTNYCRKVRTKLIFQGAEFLLTGLSSQKERDLEALIRKSGGVVLSGVPSPPNSRGKRSSAVSRRQLPIILCVTKLQTTKFLYGCAVGASILKVDWLTDCIASGTILQPEKYLILPNRNDMKLTIIGKPVRHSYQKPIFERVGIMLHGKYNFCTKLTSIIKHSGAQVFKTLQWLVRSIDEERISVGALVAEDKPCISRHLKYCASERGIPIMPSSWIIKSLYSGKLLPFTEENHTSLLPVANVLEVPDSLEMSEEI